MLPTSQFTGEGPIVTSLDFNTNAQNSVASEHNGSAFNPSLGTPTEPSQNNRGLSGPYGLFPQPLEASTPIQSMYSQEQGAFDQYYSTYGHAHPVYGSNENTHEQDAAFQNQGVYNPQHSVYSQTQPIYESNQTAHEQGAIPQNQEAYINQEDVRSPNQEARNLQHPLNGQDQLVRQQNSIHQFMTRRGRLLRAEIENPPHLSRPRNGNMQHSPPRRAYHEAIAASPPAEPASPSSPSREEIYRLRISNLEATKKLTLSTVKAYGVEIKALEGDLELGWSMASANDNLRVLYAADVRLMELRKLYVDEGKRFHRLENEIEATWEDFMVPGEERAVMARDFETL